MSSSVNIVYRYINYRYSSSYLSIVDIF